MSRTRMSLRQKLSAGALILLLLACAYGLWYTSPATPPRPASRSKTSTVLLPPVVDETVWLRAQRLAKTAVTADERPLAQAALRLADHELEAAFTAALRQSEAHPPALSSEALRIQDRLKKAEQQLASDQQALQGAAAALAAAKGPDKEARQDELDLAQSQVELDQDEVAEANQDLLDAGGNQHQRIQSMLQEHAAMERERPAPAGDVTAIAALHGLVQQLREWSDWSEKQRKLAQAQALALERSAALSRDRAQWAAQLEASKEASPHLASHTKRARAGGAAVPGPRGPANGGSSAGDQGGDHAQLLSSTRQIAADQKILTLLDQRVTDLRQLAGVYGKWSAVTGTESRRAMHAALASVTVILGVLLALVLLNGWLERVLVTTRLDRRQLETLRTVARVALQVIAVVSLLLILIGLPGQLGTMIGIVGAGLTVAMKDFIVAFFGWLALMGKNGIRLGDWVEINGVSGEVVELNMFHTVLLETGNWADAGHPTGRRVTFTNSFAIQGHYFNFSTSGQWLWDELVLAVPYDRDPNLIASQIYKEVEEATRESAHLAEQEWRRALRRGGAGSFSATPGVIVRPAVGGTEVVVRYLTRASERFALRGRLYQSAVKLLGSAGALRA